MNEYITTARDLASYIIFRFQEQKSKIISPIKLQKALYFCFAYWAGFVGKGRLEDTEETLQISPFLFEEQFEAWVYGPVIPSIYNEFKNQTLLGENNNIFEDNEILEETINSILDDTFELSDFKLVSLSHDDDSWKKHFDESSERHNEIIERGEILDEYTLKAFG